MVWTLARLGQRVPVYGPLNTVVPSSQACTWMKGLFEQNRLDAVAQQGSIAEFAVVQLCRRTDDRYRDVTADMRQQALAWLTDNDASEHAIELVRNGGELDSEEENRVFGEALPSGLRLP